MSVQEARDYIEGLNRRHRQSWEQTRVLGRLIVKAMTGSDWDMDLPWDDEEEEEIEETTEADLEELERKAKMMEKLINEQRMDGTI